MWISVVRWYHVIYELVPRGEEKASWMNEIAFKCNRKSSLAVILFFASPQSDHCSYPIFCNYCNLVSFPALINFLCCFLQIPLLDVRYDLYTLQNLNGMFESTFYFNLIPFLKNAVEFVESFLIKICHKPYNMYLNVITWVCAN